LTDGFFSAALFFSFSFPFFFFSLLSLPDLLGFGVGVNVLFGSKFYRFEGCWKIGVEAIQDDVAVVG
jgi:hypothetical protein